MSINKDIIIVLQSSMHRATDIAIANKKENKDIDISGVIEDAKKIAAELIKMSTVNKEDQRKPGTAR